MSSEKQDYVNAMGIVATGMPASIDDYQVALNAAFAGGVAAGKAIARTEPLEAELARSDINQKPYGFLKLSTGRFFNEVEGCNPMTDKRYLPLYTNPYTRQPKENQV